MHQHLFCGKESVFLSSPSILCSVCGLMVPLSSFSQNDPKRLKKQLPKILKLLQPDDRILIVGTTQRPFDAELQSFCKVYQKIILVPRPDYASRYGKYPKLFPTQDADASQQGVSAGVQGQENPESQATSGCAHLVPKRPEGPKYKSLGPRSKASCLDLQTDFFPAKTRQLGETIAFGPEDYKSPCGC